VSSPDANGWCGSRPCMPLAATTE